ncbi:hypothetical protein G7007_14560 [Pseudomonas entomophila]|nr:hypothetical protein [Pseudomonas entomophila]MBA1194060.1 hypothetical protein [Pseudomonas entomophila]
MLIAINLLPIPGKRRPCGSGLAREYEGAFTAAFAGKPAPTPFVARLRII